MKISVNCGGMEVSGEIKEKSEDHIVVEITKPYNGFSLESGFSRTISSMMQKHRGKVSYDGDYGMQVARDLLSTLYWGIKDVHNKADELKAARKIYELEVEKFHDKREEIYIRRRNYKKDYKEGRITQVEYQNFLRPINEELMVLNEYDLYKRIFSPIIEVGSCGLPVSMIFSMIDELQ